MSKLSNFCVFIVTVVACLVFLEVGFRSISGVPILELTDWRFKRATTDLASVTQYDPIVGWTTKKDVRSNWLNTLDYGIRKNHEDDDTVRQDGLLVVGDSFVAGTNVNDNETWPAYLEAIIHQPVLNAGVGGWGIDQMVLRVGQLSGLTRPKAVILAIQDQGIERDLYAASGWPKPYFSVEQGELVLHNSPVPAFVHDAADNYQFEVKKLLGYSYVADQVISRAAPDWWYTHGGNQSVKIGTDPVAVTCALAKRFKNQSDTLGFRPLFVVQYGGQDIIDPRIDYVTKVAACFEAAGISVVDTYDALRAVADRSRDELQTYYQDPAPGYGHMTMLGNRLVAELVAAALSRPNTD